MFSFNINNLPHMAHPNRRRAQFIHYVFLTCLHLVLPSLILIGHAGAADAKSSAVSLPTETINLAGAWRFQLDADKVGVDQVWQSKTLADQVTLPGTTDENKKGILKNDVPLDMLARVWFWKGAAWYQRDIMIPEAWAGKRVTLMLERTKNTRVWVDQTFCGWDHTLSAPQVFDVSKAMSPGKHTITVLVDNSIMPPVGPSHAVDERTQTNWNGIVGRIELKATDPVWIDEVQVIPDINANAVKVRAVLLNATGKPAVGTLKVAAQSANVTKPQSFRALDLPVKIGGERSELNFTYSPDEQLPLWNESSPALIHLGLSLQTSGETGKFSNGELVRFGMVEFTREGSQLMVNGKRAFLRGRLDCANYPITGYPPMDKASWQRILKIQKDWGLNHVRYHSWCPPAVAFEVADELGMYFQAELPNKRSAFKAPEGNAAAIYNIDFLAVNQSSEMVSLYDYGKREGELIAKWFGNSPSFVMFTLGNELGRDEGMFELVNHFRRMAPNRLYAQGSNNMHWNPSLAEGDDFWVAKSLEEKDKLIRGSDSVFNPGLKPHIDFQDPSTMVDYVKAITGTPVPAIGHETGQFQVYPDFRDIAKFTGVVRAKNYEIFRERLKEAGMLDQAQDFVDASGKLAAICYREDIEAALRTPGFGGFQLLDIQDFPGQGTALVGMLNDFMEPKGFIQADEWRKFCSETVPLIRMQGYTWTNEQNFSGKVQVAHYGAADFNDCTVSAVLTASDGKVLDTKEFTKVNLKTGFLNDVGEYAVKFAALGIKVPQKLVLTLSVKGTPYQNDYPLWIYPVKVDLEVPKGVMVAASFAAGRDHLASGGKVLLLPKLDKLPHSVGGAFQTDFWSPMFAQAAKKRGIEPAPSTLGILCDPKTPALAGFPTEFHSNWQWWQLVKHSRPIALDDSADDYRPLVQVIDNFDRNHKLGLIFETKVGKGSMLVCSIDLAGLQDKPEGRQMLHSLQQYVGSDAFAPKQEIATDLLEKLLPP